MKIYLDACCFNRPTDDLTQVRVFFEAEAVVAIITYGEQGKWTIASSDILDIELSKIKDIEKVEKIKDLYAKTHERIYLTPAIEQRAVSFQRQGVKLFDSLHLALAEQYGYDALLTVDDKFLRLTRRIQPHIEVANPLDWLLALSGMEVSE
jgi:predicted nucleic acid-binding protein